MNTPETATLSDLGPLRYANLDDANWLLSKGQATKEHAAAYVAMWNRPGMRLTRAELRERVIYEGRTELLAPYIEIFEA